MLTPPLLQYIKSLTTQDRKTLGQKVLKTMAEAGDLSQKVLSFESAHLATHRYVERLDILEECADVLLCVLSVAFDLQATEDELEEMLVRKTQKWGLLQERESTIKYPLPYEVHVTVAEATSADEFRHICQELKVKPIFLALQNNPGAVVMHDVMTSSVFVGDNRSASEELARIVKGLTEAGYEVVRRKIETVPWHPAAPSSTNGVSVMPAGSYFESHVGVLVEAAAGLSVSERREALGILARSHGAHLSKNAFKQVSHAAYTLMVTLRAYEGSREQFEAARDALVADLDRAAFKAEKVITEFSLFDSRTSHDSAWLASNPLS